MKKITIPAVIAAAAGIAAIAAAVIHKNKTSA